MMTTQTLLFFRSVPRILEQDIPLGAWLDFITTRLFFFYPKRI
jgi:hypothetical protein